MRTPNALDELEAQRAEGHQRVQYIENQLEDLNHYLPETYEYLMSELDKEKRKLAEIDLRIVFASFQSSSDSQALY